jgi:hypothetical protein
VIYQSPPNFHQIVIYKHNRLTLIAGREGDQKGVLDGLDGVFDSLVRRFGVERAVRTIVGVVFEG